ncbi:MAG: hypothetical protein M3P12_05195 [Gemmatimonadota bacterium]|nr:hypothetical protein [Gemmatimonadota bacterium]
MKTPNRATLVISLSFALIPVAASAQQTLASASAQARTRAIAASFNKTKHVVKEKRGVRVEKYKEVRSEPVVKANQQDYAGIYEVSDLGFAIQLRVDRNGMVDGTGYEPARPGPDLSVRRSFTLRNGKIDGALLTATKVYADGTQNRFEGVFMNRTSFDSPSDKGLTLFGLGVIGPQTVVAGLTIDRFFYELRR